MRTRLFVALSVCLVVAATGRPVAQSPARLTLVRADRMLDPRTGYVLSRAAVLIENGTIKAADLLQHVHAQAPTAAKTVDIGRATLLPGLIDSHTRLLLDVVVPPEVERERHLNGTFAPELLLAIVESPTKRAFLGAQMAREGLESGITTVRNLGHSGIDGDTKSRDAINAGRVLDPRILASARKLITRGDYLQNLNPALSDAILNQESHRCN